MEGKTYIALGDSVTAGEQDEANGMQVGWARRLAYLMDATDGPWRFTNLATGGARLYDVVTHQLRPAWRRSPVDLITLAIGINDIAEPEWPAEQWAEPYLQTVQILADISARVLLVAWPDVTDRIVPTVSEFTDGQFTAAEQAFMMQTAIRWRIETLNEIVAKAAADSGALLLNLADQYTRDSWFSQDGLHPSTEGHNELAARAARLLLERGQR